MIEQVDIMEIAQIGVGLYLMVGYLFDRRMRQKHGDEYDMDRVTGILLWPIPILLILIIAVFILLPVLGAFIDDELL